MIGGEYGFALELSICGKSKFDKDIFDEMFECSKKYLRRGYAKFIVRAILKVSLLFKK